MHTSALEARCSPGSQLPREVLAPGPLAGACSYFGKPPGKGRAQQSCQPPHSVPIHQEKGKSQAHPGLTCPAQRSSSAREPKLRAPKPFAARLGTAEPPQARGHSSPPKRTRAGHVQHPPRAPKPSPVQASAGQRAASCDTLLARTEGRALHRCPEKPRSARAPSYQPSPGEPTGWKQRGSSPTPCPLGAPSMEGYLHPLPRAGGGATRPGLSRLRRPPGELGQAIRAGRAPQTSDSTSRHGETLHPGNLTGDVLRTSGSRRMPHWHHAGGAAGWHNPSRGSRGTSNLTGAPVSCSLRWVLQVSAAGAHASPLPVPQHLPAAPRCTYRPSLEAGARCRLPATGFLGCPLSVALAAAPAPTHFNLPSEQAGQRGERHQERRDWRGGHLPAPSLPLPPGTGGPCQAGRSPIPARKRTREWGWWGMQGPGPSGLVAGSLPAGSHPLRCLRTPWHPTRAAAPRCFPRSS